MTTIQKRADELKPGDVLLPNVAHPQRIVCAVEPSSVSIGRLAVTAYGVGRGAVDVHTFDPEQTLAVEAPALTPAQQHAEELADRLYVCASLLSDDSLAAQEAKALLDKIKPPEPPTLVEALQTLSIYSSNASDARINGMSPHAAVLDLLDRARRAGALK